MGDYYPRHNKEKFTPGPNFMPYKRTRWLSNEWRTDAIKNIDKINRRISFHSRDPNVQGGQLFRNALNNMRERGIPRKLGWSTPRAIGHRAMLEQDRWRARYYNRTGKVIGLGDAYIPIAERENDARRAPQPARRNVRPLNARGNVSAARMQTYESAIAASMNNPYYR